jgi:hypothetical protein
MMKRRRKKKKRKRRREAKRNQNRKTSSKRTFSMKHFVAFFAGSKNELMPSKTTRARKCNKFKDVFFTM